MGDTNFYIVLNLKTAEGFNSYGRFFIGKDKNTADEIFKKLKGNKKVTEKSILTLELREATKGLPLDVQLISCTLEELAENCKTITKETFKLLNLKEM